MWVGNALVSLVFLSTLTGDGSPVVVSHRFTLFSLSFSFSLSAFRCLAKKAFIGHSDPLLGPLLGRKRLPLCDLSKLY